MITRCFIAIVVCSCEYLWFDFIKKIFFYISIEITASTSHIEHICNKVRVVLIFFFVSFNTINEIPSTSLTIIIFVNKRKFMEKKVRTYTQPDIKSTEQQQQQQKF